MGPAIRATRRDPRPPREATGDATDAHTDAAVLSLLAGRVRRGNRAGQRRLSRRGWCERLDARGRSGRRAARHARATARRTRGGGRAGDPAAARGRAAAGVRAHQERAQSLGRDRLSHRHAGGASAAAGSRPRPVHARVRGGAGARARGTRRAHVGGVGTRAADRLVRTLRLPAHRRDRALSLWRSALRHPDAAGTGIRGSRAQSHRIAGTGSRAMADYRIEADVFNLNPGYRRGLVLARAVRNGPAGASLTAQLRAEEAALRQRIQGNVAEYPRIAAWREAYRRFGARPSDFRASVEALARRVLRGDELPSINALVDIGNLVCLRYVVPVGVHPVPAGSGALCLRRSRPGDSFQPPDGAA